jgi:hypothetical protein
MTRPPARSHGAVIQHARPLPEGRFWKGVAWGLLFEAVAFVFVCVVVIFVLSVQP